LPLLARILKDRGIVGERELQEGIHHQVLYGGRLGTNLYELGLITEERLREVLCRAHGMAYAPLDLAAVQPEALALVSRELASARKVCPWQVKGKTLFLLMVDPNDHQTLAKIGYSRGYIVKPLVVPEFRMIQLLRDHYGVDGAWRFDDVHRPARMAPLPSDIEAATAMLDQAGTRDEVVDAVLGLFHSAFRRVVFFIVREPWVLGWSACGEGTSREEATALRIPLDQPSVFQMVARAGTVFVGRLGPEEENRRVLELLGKRANTNAVLVPVALKGRVVNMVWADNGPTGNVRVDMADLLVRLQKVPRAYLRIIRRRVAETRRAVAGTAPAPEEDE